MTLEEVEVTLKKLADIQVVHGELLHRVERVVLGNSEAIARNTEAIARNTEAIAQLTDGMQVMQAAMHRLFEHMDRFIRGLEGDGHRGPRP